jgi:hypothetical protein
MKYQIPVVAIHLAEVMALMVQKDGENRGTEAIGDVAAVIPTEVLLPWLAEA